MARTIATGIDIGTYEVKVVVAEEVREKDGRIVPKVIGTGVAESKGLHHGYILNVPEAARSIREAVNAAEKSSGMRLKRAFFSISGIGLGSITATGSAIITRADLEVTERDMALALEAAEDAVPSQVLQNKRIVNPIPLEYKIDGKPVHGRVEGMRGAKLEVKALFITCLEHHIEDLIRAVEAADMEAVDLVASPLAASFVTLSKKDKKAGCLLANLGSETLSIAAFENGAPISLEVFPIGSTAITHDLALGLKIPLEEAETVKHGGMARGSVSKKKLDDIIRARIYDMLELIEGHLKKIGRDQLLPAGIVITGGGAGLTDIKDLAADELGLPARIGEIHFGSDDKGQSSKNPRDNRWAVACGLAIFGFNAEDEQHTLGHKSIDKLREGGKKAGRTLSDWIGRFLP